MGSNLQGETIQAGQEEQLLLDHHFGIQPALLRQIAPLRRGTSGRQPRSSDLARIGAKISRIMRMVVVLPAPLDQETKQGTFFDFHGEVADSLDRAKGLVDLLNLETHNLPFTS